jgi:hypothetical protein
MSHSTVLVIGEDPEKMLLPYDENTEVEPYRTYEDVETPQEHWLFDVLTKGHGLAPDADWAAFVTARNERYDDEPIQHDADTNKVYSMSTYNPLSRWDWYQLGGRWTGFFKLRPGAGGATGEPGLMTPRGKVGWADQARKRDIDFEGMRDAAAVEGRADACLPFAVLDEAGWHERGRMGWWGVVRNETDTWQQTAQSIIDGAPDDALFSIYDVHI